jgi:LPS export ABC transporter protein LptC
MKMKFWIVNILFALIFFNCNKKPVNHLKHLQITERPSYKSKDVSFLYSDSTHLKAILSAKEMISYEKNLSEPFVYFPKNIKIIFYNDQQIPSSTLTAQQAVYFTKTQKAYLKYDVNFINDKNEHLITENIVWNQSSGKITTDKPVKIITPTQIINGTGIECEEDFSEYTIKNITGIIQLK